MSLLASSQILSMDGYSQQPASGSRQNQHALDNPTDNENLSKIIDFSEILDVYPLFGPFGATIGKTIPITPKMAVKMMNGRAPMAIIRIFQQKEIFKTKFSQNHKTNEGMKLCGLVMFAAAEGDTTTLGATLSFSPRVTISRSVVHSSIVLSCIILSRML